MAPESDEIDLIEYLKVLWKWKWLIAGGTILAAIVSFMVVSRTPLAYEASVTLVLAPSNLPGALGAPSEPMVTPNTVVDLMNGRSLAAEVIQRFSLDKPPHMVNVDSFVSKIISVEPVRKTNFITLTVTLPDPQLAADAANFLAQKGVERQARLNQGGALAIRDFFRHQRDQARQASEQSRAALMDFRRAANLDSFEIQQRVALEEKIRLKIRAAELSTEEAGMRTREQELSKALKLEEPTLTLSKSILTDPSLLAAATEYGATGMKTLSSLQVKSQEINATYQSIREDLINAEASLASLKSMREAVERKVEEDKKRLAEIGQRIDAVKPKLESLTESHLQDQATYQFWSRKADEVILLVAAGTPDLRIVEPATVPTAPKGRKVKQKVGFAGALAFITCVLLAFFLEYLMRIRQQRGEIR